MTATAAWPGKTPLARLIRFLPSLLVLTVACATMARERAAAGPRTYPLSSPVSPHPSQNWSIPPLQAEKVLRSGKLEIESVKAAGGGVTGAHKLTLRSPELEKEFVAKWKEVPHHLESWNNSPRREIAAYEAQKLFLDPEDFIVPPSVMRCIPLDDYRAGTHSPKYSASLGDTSCVLGNLSLWLENVTVPDPLYDKKRFAADPNYAARMADFNLLTYLIDHKDGRSSNFLVSKDEDDRRVFAVDNGISFDAWVWNYFVRNWNDIRVPALRKRSVDRLRTVRPEQVKALAVVAELHRDENGVLEPAEHGTPLSKNKGARRETGVVQFGLMADEVEDILEHIDEILTAVDSGKIPVF